MDAARKEYGRPLLVTIAAAIYALLYGSSIIYNDFQLAKAVPSIAWRNVAFQGVTTLAYAWAILFFITIHRVVLALFLPFIFFTGALASYFVYNFKIRLDEQVIPVLFETNLQEASGFINPTTVGWCVLSLALSALLVWLFFTREKKDPKDMQLVFISGCFLFCLMFLDDNASKQYMPYNYIKASGIYALKKSDVMASRFDVSNLPFTQEKESDDLTVVVVIGESARAANFHINGYARETTPLLEKREGLVNYKDVTSCAALTRSSVPCLMTRATTKTMDVSSKETSFVSLFRKAGWRTAWIDVQGAATSVFDSPVMGIAQEAATFIGMNNDVLGDVKRDENAIAYVDQLLKDYPSKLLLVVHSFGSHWPFDVRYDERFRKWTPVCGKTTAIVGMVDLGSDMIDCGHEKLVNEYDNSILYTDYILNEIMTKLEGRKALMVYVSDHGQSLGEDGYYLHGHMDIANERKVPMMWWGSDSWRKANTARQAALQKHAAKAQTHDAIFHSVIDCAGFESEAVDKQLSLCR